MKFRASYWATLKDGKTVHLCGTHVTKVAKKLDGSGRMAPKRGVKRIGSLSPFSLKTCLECQRGK